MPAKRAGKGRGVAVVSIVAAAAAAVTALLCIAILICTLVSGYPDIFGKGCFLYSASAGSELPDDTLVLFDPCGAEDLSEGEFAVFRLTRGMSTGRVTRLTSDRIVVETGRDRMMSLPQSAVFGRATGHDPSLGRVLNALAVFDVGGMVLGVFFAVAAGISLIVGLRKQALPQAEPYERQKRKK